jgi:succinate-semialdehyde dehydrogenase / glutarate-semialdehyde dehydrogenase
VRSTIHTTNPSTGSILCTYESMTDADIEHALSQSVQAQRRWAVEPFDVRATTLCAAAAELRLRRDELAALVTLEVGKPLRESLAEVEKCAIGLEYYAEHGEHFLRDEPQRTSADRSWVSYEPLGTVLAIMPWNFPLWQVFRFAAPVLMAGNAALLKHSPNTTGTALEVQRVLEAAGVPKGLCTTLLVAEADVPIITERLLSDPRVNAVSLTGSESAGSAVGSVAGREIKKSVLELGGADPFIVLADAELPAVAKALVGARFLNAGQSCISPKRCIVEAAVAAEFTELVIAAARELVVGDPCDPATDVGPMARADLRDQFAAQIAESVAAGADLLLGGHVIDDMGGYFYAPTVLGNVTAGMPAYGEELFGPAISIITVRDQAQAVEVAEDTRYGLGASIWGDDVDNAVAVGRQITSGACFINAPVASHAAMPFGGTKRSGFGRELWSAGIREFTSIRTWWAMDRVRDGKITSE